MSTWTDLFAFTNRLLTTIWDGIFSIQIFDGLTGKLLLIGIFALSVGLGIYRWLLSNTHAAPTPITTESISSGIDRHGHAYTSSVRTTTRRVR